MRRMLWYAVGVTVLGAVSALLATGYAARHPDSWVGRLAIRALRLMSSTSAAPAAPGGVVACEPQVRPMAETREVPAPRQPVADVDREFLEVIEPIIVEPPVAAPPRRDLVQGSAQPGVEESELPPLPIAIAEVPPPARMPLADQTEPAPGGCALCPTLDSLLKHCCGCFWPGCRMVLQQILTAPGPQGAAEEAEAVETLPYPQSSPVAPVNFHRDPHSQYCPYHGHCPAPFQYRYVEIPPAPAAPSQPPTMPPADQDRAEEQEDRPVREVLPEPRRED